MATEGKDKLTSKQWLGILSAISITTALSWVSLVGSYKERIDRQEITITELRADVRTLRGAVTELKTDNPHMMREMQSLRVTLDQHGALLASIAVSLAELRQAESQRDRARD